MSRSWLARLTAAGGRRIWFPAGYRMGPADDRLYLLQSRPVTSISTPRTAAGAVKGPVLFWCSSGCWIRSRRAATLRLLFATGAGLRVGTPETQECCTPRRRLWVNVTALMRNSIGRQVFHRALEFLEPTVRQALEAIWDDPRLQPGKRGISLRALRQMAGFFMPLAGNGANLDLPALAGNSSSGTASRCGSDASPLGSPVTAMPGCSPGRSATGTAAATCREAYPVYLRRRSEWLLSAARQAGRACPEPIGPPVAPRSCVGGDPRPPHNPTTEMDLALWEARAIRATPIPEEISNLHGG
jgi:hypothetical protein